MDVIALDQAGISEAVAPLGTAMTEAQLGLLWRLSPTPILCFDGDAAGQKAAARAALRALPHLAPGRSLSFATLPAGQDPDDLVRASGRGGIEALLADPEPLVERLWRHECAAEPLATPEQKAGLRRRLLDHAAAIADPDVRDQYRAELLRRFSELTRPPQRPWTPAGARRPFVAQRPLSAEAKGLASSGLDPRMTAAVLHGLLLYPQAIADHGEAIAALPIANADARRLRDELVGAGMSHAELDREQLHTILAASGAAALAETLRRTRGLAFSFTRRDADPERALRDLVLVIDTLAAQPGIDAALEAATARLMREDGDEAAFREQQRLLAARGEAERQLAALVESGTAEKTEQGV
jgi:DNA primase